ncbi:MAG: hypothetical protein DWQ05_16290 [Calditrichaeota bacterium]|nr:MAG: hypothetical protein DWQ05_16290 [Calditrichota bacterium]
MINQKIVFRFLLIFILNLVFHAKLHSQSLSVDPPLLELSIQDQNIMHPFPQTIEVAVNSNAPNWSIVCQAQPFLSNNTSEIISEEHLLIHHEYLPIEGEGIEDGYQRMNGIIFIAQGGNTNGVFTIVNHLDFKFELPQQFTPDAYQSEIRIQYSDNLGGSEELIINVLVNIKKSLSLTSNFTNIIFNAVGKPRLFEQAGEYNIELSSNYNNWDLRFELSNFSSSNLEMLFSDIIFMQINSSEYNGEYVSLKAPYDYRHHLESFKSQQYYSLISLKFKFITKWIYRTGHYESILKIYAPENLEAALSIPVELDIATVNSMELSATNTYFHVDGPPDVWDSDKSIKITVGSNCGNWSVMCKASELANVSYKIPKDRIFLKLTSKDYRIDEGAGLGYQSLKNSIQIVNGSMTMPAEMSEMYFRLKTLETDRPGRYTGTITLTQLVNP